MNILIIMNERITHVEPHIKESASIRDLVFGFGDGINTSLGIVAGVGGAVIAADVVILAALVGMFTGAKAMAVQNYLAVKSQREILESEIKREEFEIKNMPERERQEIEKVYREKGFTGDELKIIVDKITSNKDVWLKTMLTEELGLNLEILGSPIKGALVMFGDFFTRRNSSNPSIFCCESWNYFFDHCHYNRYTHECHVLLYSWCIKGEIGKEKLG